MKKRLAALLVAVAGVAVVCDLTVTKESHIKGALDKVQTVAKELLDDDAPATKETTE